MTDNFVETLDQAIHLCRGYYNFLEEEYDSIYCWNVVKQIIFLRKLSKTSKKIINFCSLIRLHIHSLSN